jgi:hypothetical protein
VGVHERQSAYPVVAQTSQLFVRWKSDCSLAPTGQFRFSTGYLSKSFCLSGENPQKPIWLSGSCSKRSTACPVSAQTSHSSCRLVLKQGNLIGRWALRQATPAVVWSSNKATWLAGERSDKPLQLSFGTQTRQPDWPVRLSGVCQEEGSLVVPWVPTQFLLAVR